ncbi:hypothetical protein AHAT_09530 [Agarivorans sp. Toyoura001]|uniref:hypothetical protein n=1 Tax=Agarivorans sp. Toyoura001 TaxID=2283141 RepID=UPI0010E44B7B|nr:hypothetical protein [Agarivorans sp. Toyoura001]GDY25063.1 hypothetical protein AHAT_09530 [Agarivorans sp. Toyoura001]
MQPHANFVQQSKFNQTLLVDAFGQSYVFVPRHSSARHQGEQLHSCIDAYWAESLLQNHSTMWGYQFDVNKLYSNIAGDFMANHKTEQQKHAWLSKAIISGEVKVYKGESFAGNAPTDTEGGIPVATLPEKSAAPRATPAKETLGQGGKVEQQSSQPPSSSQQKQAKTAPKRLNPAQTINEASTRLKIAKTAITDAKAANSALPKTPYTLEDKLAIVENGLNENILVRIIETAHSGDSGTIGQVKGGRAVTWTAPMNQVEHADSDAELLLNAFGTRYKPEKTYTMLLIDKQKVADAGDVVSVIPTFDNMKQMIAGNPDMGIDPNIANKVMNEDFAPKYEEFANNAWDAGVDMDTPDDRIDYAINELGYDVDTAKLLSKRHDIATKISAWEIFTGNGMTRDTNVTSHIAYGPVEVFTYDKNPQQLGKLESLGAIKRIDL